MTEFQCSCHIEGKTYNLLTVGCVLTSQALNQFRGYVESEGGEFELADGLIIDKLEVEE